MKFYIISAERGDFTTFSNLYLTLNYVCQLSNPLRLSLGVSNATRHVIFTELYESRFTNILAIWGNGEFKGNICDLETLKLFLDNSPKTLTHSLQNISIHNNEHPRNSYTDLFLNSNPNPLAPLSIYISEKSPITNLTDSRWQQEGF